ncbi:DUF805 domain-containing protein [Bifidobacterium vansinderenii]|uniref:DUF805 domain-containing protein n=1 Tax=Bifidobacterium vansinderenii TaxID=1984871 RepID=A0A229VUM3_9BIFI|nr:DUF805 domain-containing protein [Bifidobacterium vansinderenii]OXM99291.1 hypothetical protein Tam10B_2464 [Bifidobacterium vansinderenii]
MTDPNNNGYTGGNSNPYGQNGQSGYGQNYGQSSNGANPYGQPSQPAYGQQPGANPYGQSPYGQTGGQTSGSPYTQNTNPYGQPGSNPYGQPGAQPSPYGQPSANPYTQNTNPYGQPGQPGYGQQPPMAPTPQYGGQNAYSATGEPPLWAPWYGISFPNAIVRFFKKYAVFHGRASRSEYWWWFLFSAIIGAVFSLLSSATDGSTIIEGLEGIWNLAVLVPGVALAIRRMHDANRSGWWVLLPYGLIVLAIIVMLLGGGAAFWAAAGNGGVGSGVSSVGLIIVGLLLMIAGGITSIVLYIAPSDPQGARFDRPNA